VGAHDDAATAGWAHPGIASCTNLLNIDSSCAGMRALVLCFNALQDRWAGLVVFSGAMGVVWTMTLRWGHESAACHHQDGHHGRYGKLRNT
jgi:hypothetical protein